MAFKKYNRISVTTPNIFLSEGLAPDRHQAASYLPLIRYDRLQEDYKVISAGKPVALDSAGYLVPAGLAVQLRKALAAAGNYDMSVDQTDRLTRYTATDIAEGVLNRLGQEPKLNEPVIFSFFKSNAGQSFATTNNVNTSSEAIESNIGPVIGLVQYDVWRQNGAGFGQNPTDYTFTNYNMQQSVAIITKYYIEVPILADYATYDLMPFAEAVCFIGGYSALTTTSAATSVAGTLTSSHGVKVDAGSNFALWVKGTDPVDERVGKVVRFLDTTEYPKNALDKVKSWPASNQSNFTALDKVASLTTGGLPEKATYAGLDATSVRMVRIFFEAL